MVFIAASLASVQDPHMTGIMSMVCGGLAFFTFMLGVLLGRIENPDKRRSRRLIFFHSSLLLLAAGLMFGLYADRYFTCAAPVRQYDQMSAEVLMEPLDYPTRQYGKHYYPVRILELDGEPVEPFRVRLSCSEAMKCEPCDRVRCQVKFYSFKAGGMYSTYSSQLAQGNLLGAYPEGYNAYEYFPAENSFPLGRLLPMLRRYVSRGLDRCISGDEAALLKTVLLGRGFQLSEEVYTDFRLIGCSHMLAVSGLHMTLVGAFLNLFLARLPVHRRLRSLAAMALLFLYLLLTGFPVSAVRSYVMFAFCSLASAAYELGDTLNSLGAAVTLICFSDPFAGGSVGFALSVLATAGISLLGRRVEEMICPKTAGPIRRYMAGTVSTTISATLFTLPVQIAVFHGLPLLTIVSNMLLLPLFVSMLYGALPLLILSLFDPAGALIQPFVLFCGLLARTLLKLSRWMARLPGIYLSMTDPILLIALALLMITIWFSLSKRSRLRPVFMTLSLTMALFLPVLRYESRLDTVTLAVSGDGESSCVVVMQDGRAAVLSMGTFKSGLARQIMVQENIHTLESVLVTRQDLRAKAMLRDLLSNCRPKTVLLCGGSYAGKDLRYPGVRLVTVSDNCLYQVLPGIMVQVDGGGEKIRIWANNKKLLLVSEDCAGEACDLLITGRSLPQIDTELTLFMCGEDVSPEEAGQELYSDFYLVTDQSVRNVDIIFDGEISMRSW